MYNVLPKKFKGELKKEYRLRLTIVTLWGIVVVLIVTMVGLLPTYFSVAVKESQMKAEYEKLSQFKKSEDVQNMISIFSSAKEKIKFVEEEVSAGEVGNLMSKLLKLKPEGVSIGSVVYEKRQNKSVFIISGVAAERKDVISFRNNIEKIDPFEKAELPVEVLAKGFNTPFTLTVRGLF